VVLAVAPAALLLTPYGFAILGYYHDTLFNHWFGELITEWRPVTSAPGPAVFFFLLAGTAIWSFGRNPHGTTRWERVALLVLLVAGVSALRNLAWVTLAAIPVVAASMDPILRTARGASAQAERLNRMTAWGSVAILAAVMLVTVERPADWFERDLDVDVLRAVQATRTQDPSLGILADLSYADWLLWRDPRLRGHVAFDGRLELLSRGAVRTLAATVGYGTLHPRELKYGLVVFDPAESPVMLNAFATEPRHRILTTGPSGTVVLRQLSSG
jgi:hypothetical protein